MLRAKIMKVFAVSLLVSALVVLLLQADFWMGGPRLYWLLGD